MGKRLDLGRVRLNRARLALATWSRRNPLTVLRAALLLIVGVASVTIVRVHSGLDGEVRILDTYVGVLDGDTLVMRDDDGTRLAVDLFGIDAADVGQMCMSASREQFDCGHLAASYLETRIIQLGRGDIRCRSRSEAAHGQLLARCKVGDIDLGGMMVEEGYAWAVPSLTMRYFKREAVAMNTGRGLWSGTFENPSVARKRCTGRRRDERPSGDSGDELCT